MQRADLLKVKLRNIILGIPIYVNLYGEYCIYAASGPFNILLNNALSDLLHVVAF